jgi:cytochrome c
MPIPFTSAALRAALLAGVLSLALRPIEAQTSSGAASAAPAACQLGTARTGSRVLVFSKTAGFRHASIPNGIAAVKSLGASHNFAVEATEDASAFTDTTLRRFSAVVFMMTTGDVLDSAQQAAFQRFIHGGGGYVGVHSATDTEYDWPWYGQLVGAYFKRHPAIQQAKLDVVDRKHVSTKCLMPAWTRTDEWYDFRAPPASDVHILITLDEKSYQNGGMGAFHPVAWYHSFDGGRAFYTELGHTPESYADPAYLNHLAGGILWAIAH